MCKVSTLRNAEPQTPQFCGKLDQLPKINKSPLVKTPILVSIEEHRTSDFALPQLIESHLPAPFPSSAGRHGDVEDVCTLKKVGYQGKELPAVRRCGTPFVSNQRCQTVDKSENSLGQQLLACKKEGSQGKCKLHVSKSCPEMSRRLGAKTGAEQMQPTPPTSPPKHRPSTPFILNRARSLEYKRLRLNRHILEENGDAENHSVISETVDMPFIDRKAFLERKIDRDKLESAEEDEKCINEDAIQSFGRIRMDKNAFKQWIQEHRLP